MSTSTDTPAGRVATPGWSGDRLPVAPRQRRPGLAILAVVLILGGALFSAALVLRSGAKVSVVVLAADVPQGDRFTATDFRQAQIAPGDVKVVKWSQRGDAIGKTATVFVMKGTLLNSSLLGVDPQPRDGFVIAPASLKAGQVLTALSAGDQVRVMWTPPPGQQQSVKDGAPTHAASGIVVDRAVVDTVSGLRPDGTILITLIIPEDRQSSFAQFATLQSIDIVKLHQAG